MRIVRRITRILVLLLLPPALVYGCGGSDDGGGGGGGTTPPTIVSVTLAPGAATLTSTGQTVEIAATVVNSEGTTVTPTLTWTSSAQGVATVNASGVVTAVANGTSTVTASTGGVSGSSTITVSLEAATITVTPTEQTLDVGGTVTLSATVADASGATIPGAMPSWASSDEGVATVDQGGVVTAVSGGAATITASVGEVSAAAEITVNPEVASVVVTPAADTVDIGATITLTAAALDDDGAEVAGATFTWASADEAVATVDATGVVTGVAGGTVEISATAEGVTGTAEVRVNPADVVVTEDTTLGGTLDVDEFVVESGVTVTLEADFVLRAEGDVRIAGDLVGECRAADLSVSGRLEMSGTLNVACTGSDAETSDRAITITALGDVQIADAEFRASGGVTLQDDPDAVSAPAGMVAGVASVVAASEWTIQRTGFRILPERARDGTGPGRHGDDAGGPGATQDCTVLDPTPEVQRRCASIRVLIARGSNVTLAGVEAIAQHGGHGGDAQLGGIRILAMGGNGGYGGSIFIQNPVGKTIIDGGTYRAGDGGNGGLAIATATGPDDGEPFAPIKAAGGIGGRNGNVFFFGSGLAILGEPTIPSSRVGDAGETRAIGWEGADAGIAPPEPGGRVEVIDTYVPRPMASTVGGITVPNTPGTFGPVVARPGTGGDGNLAHPTGAHGGSVWVLPRTGPSTGVDRIPVVLVENGHGGRGADVCLPPEELTLETLVELLVNGGNSDQYLFNAGAGTVALTVAASVAQSGTGGDGGAGSTLYVAPIARDFQGRTVIVEDGMSGGAGGAGDTPGAGGAGGQYADPVGLKYTLDNRNSFRPGAAGGACSSSLVSGSASPVATVSTAADGTRTVTFSGNSPFLTVSGALAEDNSFSIEGTGQLFNIDVRNTFQGTFDPETGTLDGEYSIDVDAAIASGHPVVYRIRTN